MWAGHVKSLVWLSQLPSANNKRVRDPTHFKSHNTLSCAKETEEAIMARVAFMLLVLVLLCEAVSSGQVEFVGDAAESAYTMNEIHARKFLVEISLDYDDGGANNKHDPKKGKPGIGAKYP